MPFKVSDFHDLVDLLETHPQWRAQLRRLVLTEDVLALPRIVQELAATVRELAAAQQRLAEAQQRTEQRVEELAAAQQRTEQRVEELAAAQQRTEQRIEELAAAQQRTEQRIEELAAAQQRTEQRVDTLAVELRETRYQLGRLSDRVGVSVEDEAADVLRVILQRKGYRAVARDYSLALDGEVDVVLPLHDAQDQPVWAVLEAKVRLSGRAVEAWAKRMHAPDFQGALRAAGVPGPYLVYAYGMRIDESARETAQQFGIGLLSSRGEEVPPTAPLSA